MSLKVIAFDDIQTSSRLHSSAITKEVKDLNAWTRSLT